MPRRPCSDLMPQRLSDMSRKNVSKACIVCRDSKTKCDGAIPQCASCTRKGKTCSYEAREDKRKVSFRPALEVLQRRVEELDRALLDSGGSPPQMNEADELLVNRVLEIVGLPILPINQEVALPLGLERSLQQHSNSSTLRQSQTILRNSAELSETQLQLSNATTTDPVDGTLDAGFDVSEGYSDFYSLDWSDHVSPDWPWSTLFPSEFDSISLADSGGESGLGFLRSQGRTNPTSANTTLASADASNEDEVDQELIGQIAARFGSLHVAPDGKLRYFGTPTNLHLLTTNKYAGPYSNPRSIKIDGVRLLRNAELDQEIDEEVERHLIDLYFTWHNSCNPVVDKSAYWTIRKQSAEGTDNNGYYSDVLTNAICAVGASYEARYYPRLVTFPRSLAEFFADRAKILLEIELDSPCVATVQTLLLLSSHELGYHRTARSWLYSGMAMRLCFDLGLHINTQSYVDHGVMSSLEAQARETTFWASYVMNYRMSFSLGRPFTLDASEITVIRPSAGDTTSQEGWRPYPPPRNESGLSPVLVSGSRPLPDLTSLIADNRITLCDIVEPIARALQVTPYLIDRKVNAHFENRYGNTQIQTHALMEMSEKATVAMFRWKENLPTALKLSEEPHHYASPQLLVLHMEYHYLQILVHRPWASRRHQPSPPRGRGFRHARQTCVTCACEMASIVATFERCFGCRRLDVETAQMLPSAALILIFAAISLSENTNEDPEILTHLNTFLHALDELSNVHVSARGHLDSLLLIQERWHRLYKQKQGKRKEGSALGSTDGSLLHKKLRTQHDKG